MYAHNYQAMSDHLVAIHTPCHQIRFYDIVGSLCYSIRPTPGASQHCAPRFFDQTQQSVSLLDISLSWSFVSISSHPPPQLNFPRLFPKIISISGSSLPNYSLYSSKFSSLSESVLCDFSEWDPVKTLFVS